MIKYLQILLILFSSQLYSLSLDSLLAGSDSLQIDSTLSLASKDSVLVIESSKIKNAVTISDTIVPINEQPLSSVTNIINKKSFLFENYRYTGDFLRLFPLNFIRDLAFLGQPNESFIYGAGFGGISFMEDGLLWNDRYNNTLNLNYVQSEDIDSIEVIPAPKGFLFGPYNNPVTVNFIMKDFVSTEPYSRIRYYEGPDGEAMIDGKFNVPIYKRWNLSFQVTNRASDDRYINTDYSMWQINARLKYFPANTFNITAIYKSVDSEIGLNGGVDVDSISLLTTDANSVLFNETEAIVNYPSRIQKILNHNVGLKIQTLPWDHAYLDLSVFYRYSDDEISNDMNSVVLKDRYDNKNFSAALNFKQRFNTLSLRLISTYDKNNTTEYAGYLLNNDLLTNHDYFSAGSIISLNLLDGRLVPSIFYKYSYQTIQINNEDNSAGNSGYGMDVSYNPLDLFSIYSGYSVYDQVNNDNVRTFEVGGKIQSETFFADIKYFSRKNFFPFFIKSPFIITEENVKPQSINGLGMAFNFKLWEILLETTTSYYFDIEAYSLFSLPEIQFSGGIYLNDKFFDESLLLKTGIKFYYTGKHMAYAENSGFVNIEASKRIDFTLVGEIKKTAIVYFIWENLADNEYFITPYYPMPGRNIRFGLSWELLN